MVIPIWNQPELTRRCFKSLISATAEPVRLILVDNGSEAPTRALLEEILRTSPQPVQLIRNERNLGFIQAVNQGIQAGRSPWVCLLNNDTVVTSGWLTQMLKVGASDPGIGLINPTSNSLGFSPGKLSLEEYARSLLSQSGASTELSTALGFCLLARRDVFEKVGLLDESFGMGNFDDDDLSRRVKRAGLRCVRACAAYVFHEEKASFRQLPRWEEAFEENRRRFEARWGRRLRILCEEVSLSLAMELLKEGHWLYLIGSPHEIPPELSSHAQVSCLELGKWGWRLKATLKVLTKRKKPFDVAIGVDPRWGKWLEVFQKWHRATLLWALSEKEILARCRELCRYPS